MAVHGAPLRAGVVGTGHMGQYHVLVYAELPDVELVGVADTDADRAAAVARQYETQPFTDHRELIGKVDVASVAVPTERHFAVARDLLEAGVSVLVEKPMTTTIDEAQTLFRIAERTGAVLHVGPVERFNGAVDELRRIVRAPILIESRRLGPFAPRVQRDGNDAICIAQQCRCGFLHRGTEPRRDRPPAIVLERVDDVLHPAVVSRDGRRP